MSCHIALMLPVGGDRSIEEIEKEINNLDLLRIETLLEERIGISRKKARKWTALFRKTLRFLANRPGYRLWIHEEADEVLHLFILDTEVYPKFCRKIFGRFLPHKLRLSTDIPEEPVEKTIDRSQKFWRDIFGENYFKQGTVKY